jgi:chemotaxis methyl-accepting protein methylase
MSTFNLSLNHHLDLPDDVFRLMRDQIYKRTGMWFSDTSKYLLQKRLSPRARELNFESFQKVLLLSAVRPARRGRVRSDLRPGHDE